MPVSIRDYIKEHRLFLDGAMGTMLQKQGLPVGELPERLNITDSDRIKSIHKAYFDVGCNVVSANTFGANILKFSHSELEDIIAAAFKIAYAARAESCGKQEKFIALDIGSTGKLLKPYGDFDFEEAVSVFAETVKLGVKYGAELIFIETMNDSYETKAAVLAAKENSSLPIFVSNAYGADGKLMTGATPAAMVAMLEGLGVDAIGVNCSLGPASLKEVVRQLVERSSLPVLAKPNAGLPVTCGGETFYDIDARQFVDEMKELAEMGAMITGGCCGTTPEYLALLVEELSSVPFRKNEKKNITCISSYTHALDLGVKPVLIGERINPTGKKRFKQALKEEDIDYILGEGLSQQEKGVHALDVNVGLPEIDEVQLLTKVVCELQAVSDLPLQIDTSDCKAMEKALRRYNGKAMINSVNGKEESMRSVFPLVKKYGGVVVALTLDEGGIPDNCEGRVKIAEKIISVAAEYGIEKKDIVFDTLAMAVSADSSAPMATLRSLEYISHNLKANTVLGVSNISFGLPVRDAVNSTFFALALGKGLSAAIINPYSADMLKVYHSFLALNAFDDCSGYIKFATELLPTLESKAVVASGGNIEGETPLRRAIIKGLKEQAGGICEELLKSRQPLEIVDGEIIPALDCVGKGFEEKRVYLPQLLMSAEAAKSAFAKIKNFIAANGGKGGNKCKFVLATVKGDIHDIGKNIVKVLLENYGFEVIDLGRDVPPDTVVEAVIKHNAPIAGLSALMTTTVPAMEETIKLIREKAPFCKVVVGGAVLTKEYADMIGADKYAADAMETVRYAEEIYNIQNKQ